MSDNGTLAVVTDDVSSMAELLVYSPTQGVINGYSDGSFKPHSNITRGQMAKILYNLM